MSKILTIQHTIYIFHGFSKRNQLKVEIKIMLRQHVISFKY